MMTIRSMAALFAAAVMSGAMAATPVRVEVTVQTDTGEPLSGVLVALLAGGQRIRDAATDVKGAAILEADIPDDETSVEIGHGFANPSSFPATQDQVDLSKRLTALKNTYHLSRAHTIKLHAGQQDYSLTITAWPAIEVRAVIVDSHERPLRGRLLGPAVGGFGWSDRGAASPLRGVRKGAPALLVATAFPSPPAASLVPIFLNAEQTSANVDLGSVTVPPLPTGVPIHVTISNDPELRKTHALQYYWPGLTFVALNGSIIVSYEAFGGTTRPIVDGDIVPLEDRAGQPFLPPGEYYVAPGCQLYNEDQAP